MVPAKKPTNASKIRKKRVFVLDTNVLLHDSNALFAFKGVVIGIPFAVLEELDEFKKERNELGMNARRVIRILDELRERGDLQKGVVLENGTPSILKVLPIPEHLDVICAKTIDNVIIQNVIDLVKKKYEVTFVTKDINLRIKADALGIDAEDYAKGTVSYEEYYKGWSSIPVSNIELKKMTEAKLPDFLSGQPEPFVNEFVVLQSQHNEWSNRVFRYLGGKKYKEVFSKTFWEDFGPRNVQQTMALDLLLDDSIKLVSLLGPAGTGKTFLALLAGLFKVLQKHEYRRFLISRPVIALGADIGYLPGDVQEKLFHWMQPIYDNLEIIFSQTDSSKMGERAKERRHRRRHPRPTDYRTEIDRLKQKGIISLEAITYMRGRSLANQYVFIDEVQNLTPHEVKTIISRAGEGTKVIIAGDPYQIDSPYLDFTSNGLTVTAEKLKQEPLCGTVFLETSERSELAKLAAEML